MINIVLILAFILEPLLWYYSARVKFEVKYMNIIRLFMLVDFIDSMIGQYANFSDAGQAFHSVIFFSYITLFICCCFSGSIKSKLKHTGTMILLYLASDIIAMLVLSVFATTDQISCDVIWNATGTLLSRIVMFGLIQLVIKRAASIRAEMVPFVFLLVLLEIPLVVMFKNSSTSKGSMLSVVMCSLVQVVAMSMMYCVKKMIDRKNAELDNKNVVIADVTSANECIKKELESVVAELEKLKRQDTKDTSCVLNFFENRKKIHINRDDILYVERVARKIIIVEQDGRKHEVNSSISKMLDLLGEQFDRINQGVIVNKNCIISVNSECVQLKGDIMLYASRRMQKGLKEGELV